jgi:glycosyltransferase involved in cell wall biosynthesis
MSSPSVALVHDYLLVMRGAERTFAAIADCWPDAPIYTLLYDEEGTRGRFSDREVHTSYLQRLGVGQKNFRSLLPAFPRAVRSLRLDGYDMVISSSSAFAHGVIPDHGCRHLCYCHSPFRYAWFESERALAEVGRPLRRPLRHALWRVREADRRACGNVTKYVANAAITQQRIRRFWGRESSVVHPPVDVGRFLPAPSEDFLLIVTELVRHKRVEVALEAASRAGRPVRVVGEGPDRARLESLYGGALGDARFLGRVDDEELTDLYARAGAFVLPNVEEFGIAAVEAQAAGTPVIAVAAGGALETVVDGETGILVEPGVEAFAECMANTDFGSFDQDRIAAHARTFSTEAFQRKLRDEVSLAAARPSAAQVASESPLTTLS